MKLSRRRGGACACAPWSRFDASSCTICRLAIDGGGGTFIRGSGCLGGAGAFNPVDRRNSFVSALQGNNQDGKFGAMAVFCRARRADVQNRVRCPCVEGPFGRVEPRATRPTYRNARQGSSGGTPVKLTSFRQRNLGAFGWSHFFRWRCGWEFSWRHMMRATLRISLLRVCRTSQWDGCAAQPNGSTDA